VYRARVRQRRRSIRIEVSLVDGEQVQGALSVGLVGLGVGAEGVQAGVPEQIGDQDRVGYKS